MKLYLPMYLLGGAGLVVGMLNGTLIDGGAHLLVVDPWAALLKASSLLTIAAWFVEMYYHWTELGGDEER